MPVFELSDTEKTLYIKAKNYMGLRKSIKIAQ